MNYTFSYLCRDFFGKGELSVSEFDAQMQRMIYRYPWQVSLAQMNFLDSHDIPRFLSYCNGNRKRMELAFFYLFMGVGVPSVFYGDEVYIEGMKELEYRAAMDWQAVMEQQAENTDYREIWQRSSAAGLHSEKSMWHYARAITGQFTAMI